MFIPLYTGVIDGTTYIEYLPVMCSCEEFYVFLSSSMRRWWSDEIAFLEVSLVWVTKFHFCKLIEETRFLYILVLVDECY